MPENDIHERAGGVFAPDTLLPSQYFDRLQSRRDVTGEQRLMFAVIADGVDDYLKHAAATHRDHRQLFSRAERWVEAKDRSWIYSFETICDHLGLNGDHVRRGLRAAKMRARGERAPSGSTVATPERRHAINE